MTPFEFVTKLHIPVTHPFALWEQSVFCPPPSSADMGSTVWQSYRPLNIVSTPLSSNPYNKVPFEAMTCL